MRSGSGTEALTFTYTVALGDASTTDLKVTGYSGTIADTAGNALVAAGVTKDTGVAITTTAPTVTSLTDVTPGGSTDLDARARRSRSRWTPARRSMRLARH